MPVLPGSVMEPVWAQVSVLLPDHPVVDPAHPLGCHRRRGPERVVFEHVLAALGHGSGDARITTASCSDRTIRRRLRHWAELGLAERLHHLALDQDDRMIGLEVDDVVVDGCSTNASGGGETAGRSPVAGSPGAETLDPDQVRRGCRCTVSRPAPITTMPRCWDKRSRGGRVGPTARGAHRASGSRRRPGREPGVARRRGMDRQHRPQRRASPAPGRCPVGGRETAIVDERRGQTAPLHRDGALRRGLVPVPDRHHRGHPLPDPARTTPVSVAQSTHHPSPQLMPIAGRSKPATETEACGGTIANAKATKCLTHSKPVL